MSEIKQEVERIVAMQEYDATPPEEYKRLGKEIADNIDKGAVEKINSELKEADKQQYDSIREYVEDHKTELNDDDVTMYPRPRSGCGHCHGIGREGWDWFSGEPVICRCIRHQMAKRNVKEYMTWKEFKELTLSKVDHSSRKTRHLTPKSLRRSLGKKVGKYEKMAIAANTALSKEED